METDLAIIGGGAAGLAAGVAAKLAAPGCRVALLESGPRVGRRLLATGNGRCNLTNMGVAAAHYHGDAERLSPWPEAFSPQRILSFFADAGLLCREQGEGRVYPYSQQAGTVLEVLRARLAALGVEIICDFTVENVMKTPQGFELASPAGELLCRRVVLATGGLASPKLGEGGGGLAQLRRLGHSVENPAPALVPLTTEARRVIPLKGARAVARVKLLQNDRVVKTTYGEVQFTGTSLSGICVFELSRFYSKNQQPATRLELDLLPEHEPREVAELLRRAAQNRDLPAKELFFGVLHKLVGREVMKQALGKRPELLACELTERELLTAAGAAKAFTFPVTGTAGWGAAQVMAGGVPLAEVNLATMESKKCAGLYLAGELLNIDGDCGGYNLHWAWSTGICAGQNAAYKL